jgi:hypothetical protein
MSKAPPVIPFMHQKGQPHLWCRPWTQAELAQHRRMIEAHEMRMVSAGYSIRPKATQFGDSAVVK